VLLDGGITIDPAWVTVRGPVSDVDRLQHVSTEPVDLGRVRETGTREVALKGSRHAMVYEPDRVAVTFRVSPRGERVLPNVPPTVLLDSDDVDAFVRPPTVSLTLEGPATVLDTLSSGDVSVLLSVSGPGDSTYRLVPDVILPPGVRLTAISADTFDVHVVPVEP